MDVLPEHPVSRAETLQEAYERFLREKSAYERIEADISFSPLGLPIRPRAAHTPRNSIDIVEDFFGEPLGSSIIKAARRLPRYQQLELCARLSTEQEDRTITSARLFAQIEPDHPYGSLSQSNDMAFIGPRSDFNVLRTVMATSPGLLTGNIHIPDIMTSPKPPANLPHISGLKHCAIYFDHTYVRDPLARPFGFSRHWWQTTDPNIEDPKALQISDEDEQKWAHILANGLRQLLPIADLVRSNYFVLAWEDHYTEKADDNLDIYTQCDPYIEWLYNQPQTEAKIKEVFLRYEAQGEPDSYNPLNEAVRAYYPHNIATAELGRVLRFANRTMNYYYSPVTSDPNIIRHLEQCARIMFGEAPLPVPELYEPARLTPSIRYGIPNLSEIRFTDIARLRQNEEIFEEVRGALRTLGHICAQQAIGADLDTYNQLVATHAEDIVRPVLEKLNTWERKAKLKKFASLALGSAVNLGMRGTAVGLGVPHAGGVGSPIGKAVERAFAKQPTNQLTNISIARKILTSLN